MSDHNANQYPEFNAQSVADGYWEVYHDDDCGEAFDWFGGAVCPKCGFRPDMQSIAARKIGKAPASQSAERMTPDKFFTEWSNRHGGIEAKMQDWSFRFAEAYAEHRTAALRAELRVAIEDGDADFWKARAESSAALVKELAQLTEEAVEMFGLFGKLMGGELTKVTAWRKAAQSLLSDPAVKKVLEEK